MPIYEYRCKKCNEIFEQFQSIGAGNENLLCPKCNTPRPERIFSAFSSAGVSAVGSVSSGCNPGSSPFT